MGLFDWLSRTKAVPSDTPEQETMRALNTARGLTKDNPKKALDALYRLGVRQHDLVCLGGVYHDSYREAVLTVWAAQQPGAASIRWPVWTEIPWARWETPMMKDLAGAARELRSELIYLTAPARRHCRDALAQLNALRCLACEPGVVMVVIGDEEGFVRREFIIQAAGGLNAESEEILPDLADFATRSRKQVRNIVA